MNFVALDTCFQVPFHFSGHDDDHIRMEIVEMDDHPYFVATQYHPEYLSRPLKPSPPFFGLILASVGKLHSYLSRGCRLSPRQLSDVESGNYKETDNRKNMFLKVFIISFLCSIGLCGASDSACKAGFSFLLMVGADDERSS